MALSGTAFAVAFSYLSIRKQDAFGYGRFDLGNMAQTVWNTAHGRLLEISSSAGDPYTRLGVHVDPILAAFAPLYRVWPDPKLLLVAQALFVAAGAWPALRIATAELSGVAPSWAPAAAVGAYLLYPPLQWATLDEFHPVTLAVPLLLTCIWLLRERRYGWLLPAAIAAALCKEEVGLLLGALGIYAAFVWRDRKAGLVLAAAGVAWSIVAFEVVIPHYSPSGAGPFAGRYDAVGGSVGGILGNVFTDPLLIAREMTSGRDLSYVAGQLAPLALLPLLAPAALAVCLPELAINLLSSQAPQTSWRFHYVAGQAPFMWWAAVLGLRRWLAWGVPRRAWSRGVPAVLVCVPLLGCLVAGYLMGPLPPFSAAPGGYQQRPGLFTPNAHDRIARRAASRLPDGVAISVGNRLGAWVSDRRRVALFPRLARSRYVVVDARNAAYGEANANDRDPRNPIARAQTAAIRALMRTGRFRTVFFEDGVTILRRVGPAQARLGAAGPASRAHRRTTSSR